MKVVQHQLTVMPLPRARRTTRVIANSRSNWRSTFSSSYPCAGGVPFEHAQLLGPTCATASIRSATWMRAAIADASCRTRAKPLGRLCLEQFSCCKHSMPLQLETICLAIKQQSACLSRTRIVRSVAKLLASDGRYHLQGTAIHLLVWAFPCHSITIHKPPHASSSEK